MKVSMFSGTVMAGICAAAALGWLGVQLQPSNVDRVVASASLPQTGASSSEDVREGAQLAQTAQATQPGVRDRSAWQPSPIPSGQQITTTTTASGGQPVQSTQPGVRDRSAWQPSPIPSNQQAKSQAQTQTQTQSQAPAPIMSVSGAPQSPSPAIIGGAIVPGGFVGAIGPVAPFGGLSVVPDLNLAAEAVGALLGEPVSVAASDISLEPITARLPYIPMRDEFSQDQLAAIFNDALPARRGDWQEVAFFSQALARNVSYMVWTPPGYDQSTSRYPSLYLLHGVGGPEGYGVEEWLGYALTEDLDRMLALGLIEPMIVVLPNGEQGYWINQADGGVKWADYVAIDLVKHVDSAFRTVASREKRAIGGLSMGGHGALQLAYNHPDTFSVAGAHSPTIRPFETSPEFFGDPQWFARYDPVSLATNTNAAQRVLTWIDVGYDDSWQRGATELRLALDAKQAPYEFRVLEGEHEGWYWKYYLPEYLYFYSAALNTPARTALGAPVVISQPLVAVVGAAITYSEVSTGSLG